MYIPNEILEFIKLIRDSVPNAVEVFSKGNCGSFAYILYRAFPGGDIYSNISHTVFYYDGIFYDITGKVEAKDMTRIQDLGIKLTIELLKPKYLEN